MDMNWRDPGLIAGILLLIMYAGFAAWHLAMPRKLARELLVQYQNPQRRKWNRVWGVITSLLFAMLFAISLLPRTGMLQQRWGVVLVLVLLYSMIGSVESLLNSLLFSEDALTRQNRAFGCVYASMAIAAALLLFTR